MIKDVLATIKKHNLIAEGNRILVGLSGGPDSVCLLHILCTLREKLHFTICAVHVNHMLRGEEAELDQNYAVELCNSLGVPLAVERSDIKAISKVRKLSVEETGREERYKLFTKHASKFGADKIAVAHNKNDQTETVLMNIIRGTGLVGLKGIDYKRDNIIRPLLDIDREQIEKYCRDNSLKPRIDSSNLENIYRRNKIRLELVPYINSLFDTNIVESISRMAGIVKEDLDYLDSHILQAYEDCTKSGEYLYNSVNSNFYKDNVSGLKSESTDEKIITEESSDTNQNCGTYRVILDLIKFNANHTTIKKGIARQAIKCVKGDYKNISFDHIESIIELAGEGHTGSVLQLPGRLTVSRSYGTLIFSIGEISSDKKIQASENELCSLKDKIETEVINIESYKFESKFHDKAFEQFFDYESLKRGITIRYRCKGDIFKPYKSNGTKKLKEFFIDEKIPRELREKIPLIAHGNEIVWIIGYKTSDKYKVDGQTKQVLRIKYNLGGQNAK